MVFGGTINLDILSVLQKNNLKSMRVSGLDGQLLKVKLRDPEPIDFGFVGEIEKVRSEILFQLLEKGIIPVITPLAATPDGTIVNINADTIATAVASEIDAENLIFITKTNGIQNKKEQVISKLDSNQAKELIEENTIKEGMAIKTRNSLDAINQGVNKVHIINGTSSDNKLKKIIEEKQVGTKITN